MIRRFFWKFISHSQSPYSISNAFRKQRFEKFLAKLQVDAQKTILDVGGSQYFWEGSGLETSVTILNIDIPDNQPSPYHWIEGDACSMNMLNDKSFDIVFSNSVIEHVGPIETQRQMAYEIRRVGKSYWVQTPNKYFPLEPHFLFPFYQYLPQGARKIIAQRWPFSYPRLLGLDPIFEAKHIWLLDYRNMASLFPEGKILREKVIGLTKSLIAVSL